jgi:hypothetical protein
MSFSSSLAGTQKKKIHYRARAKKQRLALRALAAAVLAARIEASG